MSKIRTFYSISRYGIRHAIISAWRLLTQRRWWLPPFKFERTWIELLADSNNLIGAEVGVGPGNHAADLIDTLDIEKLYLIESYENYGKDAERAERMAREKLAGFKSTKFILGYSNDVISDILEDLDFVYIYGSEYEFVRDNIANYYPLVKKGGILIGCGYTKNSGAIQAVDEFSLNHGLRVEKDSITDWFIIKQASLARIYRRKRVN